MAKKKLTVQEKAELRLRGLIEQYTWDVWAELRESRFSLDSERGRKIMSDGFDLAVSQAKKNIAEIASENERLKKNVRDLRKQLRELRNGNGKDEAKA